MLALATATPVPDALPTKSGPLSQQQLADWRAALAAEEVIAAVTQEIGTPILEVLLKNLLGQAKCADAHEFWLKVGRGELFDPSLSGRSPPGRAAGAPRLEERGGRRRFRPRGWVRCGVHQPDFEEKYGDWCVAYHGTNAESLLKILLWGLQRPGMDGVVVRHGQSYSCSGRSIYASPSVEYAAFPCYAMLVQVGIQHWVQFVLECRVRPGSFREMPGTLSSNKHWPEDVAIDPNFAGTHGLEMLIENHQDIVVSSVLLREFGAAADPVIYGDLAPRVVRSARGPEFAWSRLRAFYARVGDDLHDGVELLAKFGVADELLEQMRNHEGWWLRFGQGIPPLDAAMRSSALWFLSALVQSTGLAANHALRWVVLLDVLCIRRGAEWVAQRLPCVCAVLVRIILKDETATSRVPDFAREIEDLTRQFAQRGGIAFVQTDLHSLERAVLQDLDWRVRIPSTHDWISCFGTRLNVCTRGMHLPWVDDAVEWGEHMTTDITRRQAASVALPPCCLAAGVLTLGLAANKLFPEEDQLADILATPELAQHLPAPPEAPTMPLNIQSLCEATGMTVAELTAASIQAAAALATRAAEPAA